VAFVDKDYIGLTTPFMEGLALIAAEYATADFPIADMSGVYAKASKAAVWLNYQRTTTTVRQMEYFKCRRHVLFRQWEIGYRGPARDEKGHFRPKERVATRKDMRDVVMVSSKKSKLAEYGDIFAEYR